MAGESLTSDARRALPIRNRFTKPSKEKPSSVGRASSPSKTNLFGLRARTAATISGKPEVRLLPVLDCKEMVSSSRKTRQRNPSHFGSYIHSLPIGKLFTARAFVGVIGGLRNLSIELLEVTTRNEIYFKFIRVLWRNEQPGDFIVIKSAARVRSLDSFLNA